jgi:hypothetical protein
VSPLIRSRPASVAAARRHVTFFPGSEESVEVEDRKQRKIEKRNDASAPAGPDNELIEQCEGEIDLGLTDVERENNDVL